MTTRARKTATPQTPKALLASLHAQGRSGLPRIKTLAWGRLARIYASRLADRKVRSAIEREARACGCKPERILGLNRW